LIPPQNIEKFNNSFLEKNSIQMDNLTLLLQNSNLNDLQWKDACIALDILIVSITNIKETCTTPPILPQMQRTTLLEGYLPRKLQKEWKK
jgi:hypothetical protein